MPQSSQTGEPSSARDAIAERLWWSVPSVNDADAKAKTQQMLDAHHAEVLNEQGPEEHETVAEAAQMYRSLRTVIERTMADPARWDGDEDESFQLARYVEWLTAERAQVRTEVLTEAADKLDRIGHGAAAYILRDDAAGGVR